jgi:hypothetical protein
MNNKIRLLVFLLFIGQICLANMSSPFEEGTKTGSVFTSKDINILSETILIRIDKEFKTANYIVEYTIESEINDNNIPLLFFAEDYKSDFSVWFDNQKVSIQNIPEKYLHFENSPFKEFNNIAEKKQNETDEVSIYWNKNSGFVYKINDLKYFETNIKKGVHKVRVEYIANVWLDKSNWIKEYSFRYSLTPAKFWKSFGTLSIIVEQEVQPKSIVTNLGMPIEKEIKSKNTWTFNKIPDEYFDITYIPKPNKFALFLLAIEPFGLSLIIGLLFFTFHILITKNYRSLNLNKKYSIIVIIGSIIIPFLVLLGYLYSFDFIDNIIGKDASRYHGYVFFIMVLYPIIMPIYWIIMWLIDRQTKNKLINKQKGSS